MGRTALYVRGAIARIRSSPAGSAVVILTLALGLGANAAMFTVLQGVLIEPMPFPDPDKLVVIHEQQSSTNQYMQAVSLPNFQDWSSSSTSFEALGATRAANLTVTDGDTPSRLAGVRVTPSLFKALGLQPSAGRLFDAGEAVPGRDAVAVLSHHLWVSRYSADPGVIGREIRLEGRLVRIIGILPEGVRFPGVQFPVTGADIWTPLVPSGAELQRSFHATRVVGRLKDGVSIDQARSNLEAIALELAERFPVTNRGWGIQLSGLHEQVTGSVRPSLVALMAATGLLLLLACLNVANMLATDVLRRSPEFALRHALGASRADVFWQTWIETSTLALLGGLAGLIVAGAAVPLLLDMAGTALPRASEVRLQPTVLAFTVVLALLTSTLCAVVPVLRLKHASQKGTGKGAVRLSGGRRILEWLTVAEVGVALTLLVATGLMLRSLHALSQVDSGMDTEGVTTASIVLPAARYPAQPEHAAFVRRYVDRLNSHPTVAAAGVIFRVPLTGLATASFVPEGHAVPEGSEPFADYRVVSERTFEAFGVELLRGRVFSERDTETSADAVIVNQTLAGRYWPGQEAVGRRLRIGAERTRWREVVGVVADIRMKGLEVPVDPAVYVPFRQNTWVNALATSYVVVRSAAPERLTAPVLREVFHELDPELAVGEIRTMDEVVHLSTGQRRFSAVLFTVFGLLGYAIAAIGVYGVISNLVSERRFELAVRSAMGAPRQTTFLSVVGRGMTLAAAGCVLGLLVVAWLGRYLSSMLYGVQSMDPFTLVTTPALLIAVAILAGVPPAWRAVRIDPLKELRSR